jgi:two-component system sensor histidine kinase RegB
MAAGQFGTVVLADQFPGIDLPVAALAIGPAVIAATNLWLQRRARSTNAFAWVFVLDILCLTAELMLAGGATNPFSLLYLVHITLAATILTHRQTWLLGGLSTLCFGVLFWQYRPIPALEVHHPNDGSNLHLLGMWAGFAVAAVLVAMFSARISELLREREASLLRMQEELAKKDRLASLVTLAAGAAHELGTPLSTIAVVARELERYATLTSPTPAVAEDSRLIRTEVDRCREILQRLSIEGAEPAGEALTPVAVPDLVAVVESYTPHNGNVRVTFQHNTTWPCLTIPRHAVEQALIALVKNAVEASPAGAPVTLHVESGPKQVRFVVTDLGHGMSPETLRHVGEPFFTTKDAGKGMGLGTFLVRTLAERLGGALRFDSVPGRGTTAIFELPVLTDAKELARSV